MEWEQVRDAFAQAQVRDAFAQAQIRDGFENAQVRDASSDRKYKRCNHYLVELEVCPETKTNECRKGVVDARFAKFRASQLKTTRILNTRTKQWVDEIEHVWKDELTHFQHGLDVVYEVIYKVGVITYPSRFDTRLEEVCAAGIHYFNTLFAAHVYHYNDNISSITFSDHGLLIHLAMPQPYLPADREHFLQKHFQLQNVICAGWVIDPKFNE